MVTGILHGTNPTNPCHPATLHHQLHNTIPVGGGFATYLPPDNTYKYLGVHISLTLNWATQLASALDIIKTKGHNILTTALPQGASPRQCLALIEKCIKPAICHAMPAMPYTPTDILTLDRALAALAKKCCKLPITYPTASIHLPHTHGGLGVPSLTTNYTQIICTNLTRALNDPGKLGHITHALLHTETTQPGYFGFGQAPSGKTRKFPEQLPG